MDDAIGEAVAGAWAQLGVAGGLFFILVLVIVGGYKLAMKYMDNLNVAKKSTPPSPKRSPGPGTMMGIAAKEARDAVSEARTQAKERLEAIQKSNEDYQTRTDLKIEKITDKDDAQEEELKDLTARLIALEEWRKGLDRD